MNDHMREQVFRRMLAREAGTDANATAIAAATSYLCERLAERLTPLIGDGGVAALCARTLHLVQRKFLELSPLRTFGPRDVPFAHLRQSLEQLEPATATEAAIAVLGTASQLLASFIGESLTTRLLCDAWPDDFADNNTEETAQHD
jgi:hypothetical protein